VGVNIVATSEGTLARNAPMVLFAIGVHRLALD
jgi:hypothetical protein